MSENLKQTFDDALQTLIDDRYMNDNPLAMACRYALEGPGKRVRPTLTLLVNKMLGGSLQRALPSALAIELVHTYSLVHDDLPACDNDDLRRGRPTVHRKFDETIALLCGDALLTDAFALIDDVAAVHELANAAGSRGMVLGQTMDMRMPLQALPQLDQLHLHKTGRLIAAACVIGGLSADATADQCSVLRSFGEKIGLAFQITDDLLDDDAGTGKTAGKDRTQGKATYLTLLGPTAGRAAAERYTAEAIDLVSKWNSATLVGYVNGLLDRRF